jgi:transcriptional regulator of acetoin/glycerol metabolism
LTSAAAPVIDAMVEDLDGTQSGVLLADQNATIRGVRVTSSVVRDWFASVGAVVGARCSEDSVGTSSIGTSLELRRGIAVRGDEHFAEEYRLFGCYGHPILHPITGRQVGVLDVSFRDSDGNRVFDALVRRSVREIALRLADASPR